MPATRRVTGSWPRLPPSPSIPVLSLSLIRQNSMREIGAADVRIATSRPTSSHGSGRAFRVAIESRGDHCAMSPTVARAEVDVGISPIADAATRRAARQKIGF